MSMLAAHSAVRATFFSGPDSQELIDKGTRRRNGPLFPRKDGEMMGYKATGTAQPWFERVSFVAPPPCTPPSMAPHAPRTLIFFLLIQLDGNSRVHARSHVRRPPCLSDCRV